MTSTETIEAAIRDEVREQLGAEYKIDVAFEEGSTNEDDIIKITITVPSNRHLKDGGVFNLPNRLRHKLLSLHETRFPLIQYNSASA